MKKIIKGELKKITGGISLIFLLVLLLFGCGSPGEKQTTYNFKQGYGGLQLSFLENAPPEKIYPNSEFKLIVKLDNQAAYDLINGKVRIVGLDDRYFQVNPAEQPFNQLGGRSLTNPSGDKTFLEFNGLAGSLVGNAEKYSNPFLVKASYESSLEFADSVCLNPNFYEVYDSGCKVQEEKSYSGQGASVAVSEMEEIIMPLAGGTKAEFRFYLRNNGGGSWSGSNSKIGYLKLNQAQLGGEDFQKCAFQNFINEETKFVFTDQKQEALLICETYLKGQDSYMTTLTLNLGYEYEQTLQYQLVLGTWIKKFY